MKDLSVIVPTFRRPTELDEALRSVLAVQGLDLEVMVVDDSPEGSAESVVRALADPRVTYTKQDKPTGGCPARIRNACAAKAQGRVFYFLDDDDHAVAANLPEAVRTLLASPHGVLITRPKPFGPIAEVVEKEAAYFGAALKLLAVPRHKKTVVASLLFRTTLLVCSSCMVKREAFAKAGGFDEEIPLCEDVEFYTRAIRETGATFHEGPILERRIGAPSLMSLGAHTEKLTRSYTLIHAKYRARYGKAEHTALKVWSRLVR